MCVCLHTGVRVVQIVRHVRAPSVWRESVPSAAQTAHSAPAPQPQPSPAHHPANTQTGTIETRQFKQSSHICFALLASAATTVISVTSFLGCPLAVCQMMNRRAVVTQWTARLPQTPPATATVASQSDATSQMATRTASPVSHASPRRPSPASQQCVLLWCLQ